MRRNNPQPSRLLGDSTSPAHTLLGLVLLVPIVGGAMTGAQVGNALNPTKAERKAQRAHENRATGPQLPIVNPTDSKVFDLSDAQRTDSGGLCSLFSDEALIRSAGRHHERIPAAHTAKDGRVTVSCEVRSVDEFRSRLHAFRLAVVENPNDKVSERELTDWKLHQLWSTKYKAKQVKGYQRYPGVVIPLGKARRVFICGSRTIEFSTYRDEHAHHGGRRAADDVEVFFEALVASACGTRDEPSKAVTDFPKRVETINKELANPSTS